ncbi:hypothetical protein Taro_008456 [Colocasia esculenta]|uniref:PAR1 protein n=1 Tax=Colocasia esculenta TaxID=4460 RepID=A0A843U1W2_COLES|nr:hypothetical protein [Colocasia esculenta]
MASYGNSGASLRLGVLLALLLQCALAAAGGMITCESLSWSTCAFAFAVSSAGARCVLEKEMGAGEDGGEERHVCRTSSIRADAGLSGWIETDGCVEACGLERVTLGISSDSLLESRFTEKLCSPQCYQGCPKVVDLYFNLAAGEAAPDSVDVCFVDDEDVNGFVNEVRPLTYLFVNGFFGFVNGK